MSDPDRARWRRKAEFCAEYHISNSTVDREVRKGLIEKTLVGRTPMFRWAAPQSPQTALTATTLDGEMREVVDALRALTRAVERQSTLMRQVAQTPDAARPWWETWTWRKRVSRKSK